MTNFRPGYMETGAPLGMTKLDVALVADNTRIDCTGISMLSLTSDSATSTSRTFLLNSSTLVGHRLAVVFVSASPKACELANSGTCKLSGTWTPAQYDSITLVSDGTYWIEQCRALAGVTVPATTLTSAHIFVGDGSNLAADVAVSGVIALDNAGATTFAAGAVVNADVNAAAAIAYAKLATLASGNILVGSAGGVATSVVMSGDATIIASGAVAIGAAKVTKAMLAATVRPAYMVVYAGTFTTAGGDATESITAAGTLNTDLAFVQMRTQGVGVRTILSAVTAADAITVVLSGDPSTDHVICWQVLRATT